MKCKLCEKSESSDINSHYVSKFLSKDLFENGKSIQVKNDLSSINITDIPKEKYIFCLQCEDKFEILETISSRILKNIEEKDNFISLYNEYYDNGNHIVELLRNMFEFNLFILSLVWRISISKHNLFVKFDISDIYKEQIRQILIDNLKDKKEGYKECKSLDLGFKYIIIKSKNRNDYTRGHLSSFSSGSNIHMAFLVNFYICVYFQESLVPTVIKKFCNDNLDSLNLVLADDIKWKELNNTALNIFFDKNYKF